MIGKLKIMELREASRELLKDRFDFREFHDVVLTSGPVPLSILEENVTAWAVAKAEAAGQVPSAPIQTPKVAK